MNNKQSMKLYTEEQLTKYLLDEGIMELSDLANNLIPSIELPSDEDIDRESEVLYPINKGGSMWMPSRYDIDKKNRQEGFLEGAKWMRDKIQGGNNEQ